jgi:hypothetical protein
MNNQEQNNENQTEKILTNESEVTSEVLIERLHELRWSVYRLAKEYAAHTESNSPAVRYHSSLTKALANIDKSSLGTIKNIVHALKGEIIIVWSDVPEEEKGQKKGENISPEERLDKIEFMVAQILHKLNESENS